MWAPILVLLSVRAQASFETRAVVHDADGFCARASLTVAGGEVSVRCERRTVSRHRFAIRRPTPNAQVLALDVPMVVSVRDPAALDAALRENGLPGLGCLPGDDRSLYSEDSSASIAR